MATTMPTMAPVDSVVSSELTNCSSASSSVCDGDGGEGSVVGAKGGGVDGSGGELEGGGGNGDVDGGGCDWDGGEGDGGVCDGDDGGSEGDGARRRTETWTSATEGAAGASSMVTPNALLILARGLAVRASAAVKTGLVSPGVGAVVSVTTTVRMTLPAVAVTVSRHAGRKH